MLKATYKDIALIVVFIECKFLHKLILSFLHSKISYCDNSLTKSNIYLIYLKFEYVFYVKFKDIPCGYSV